MSKLIIKDLILNDGENIVKVVRQSKLILFSTLILPTLLILAPFFFLFLLFSYGQWGVYAFILSLIVGILLFLRELMIWRFKLFIITTQRIIDIDQKGLFKRTVSNVLFTKIDDIFYKISGLPQVIFRCGNIYITLSDNKSGLELKNIPSPQRIQQLILQLKSDTIGDKINATNLSANELIELIKKIKAGIGEKKLYEIINKTDSVEDNDKEDVETV